MKIQIQHIPAQGVALAYRKEAREFPILKQLEDEGQCRFTDPIVIELAAMAERDLVSVSGYIGTTVQLDCSRCLEAFSLPMQRRFTLRFSREIPADLHAGRSEEVELTADAIGLVYFKGEEIDLKTAMQEQVVLALPLKPLCREDCKGLCPHCGTDLNVATCACGGATVSSPFAVLKNRSWPSR